ncbi:IclR family transcriptional regulator [Leucobacter weissii]|uniref:IclR family transcriptional regulator n=1 Tax=Leucobacter weissii TaxID=1983706 RepID=A0A939MIG1_9MICO|nr:IclR family transcriptional regulator [Leucobacter weissii]
MSRANEDGDDAESSRRRQPLARGVELLTLLVDSEQESHGVRELAGRLGVSPSTAHRLLADLERLGLVGRADDGAYQLGLEFLRLAWRASARHPLHEFSAGVLEDLGSRTQETVFFGVYSPQRAQMMFAHTIESPHPLRYVIPLREWLPLHAGASGLAILAFAPSSVREQVLSGPLEAKTARTIVDSAELAERLAVIRENGFAVTHGERISGAVAIAAPVFGPGGVLGVAGVSFPESRFNASELGGLADRVRDSAARITRSLGGAVAPELD